MNNITSEYKDAIIHLIELTRAGRITWTKQSATTIYQEMTTGSGSKAIMSIQGVKPDRGHFIFTVKNKTLNEVVISIDSSKNQEFRPMLDELYNRANYSIEKRSIDYLKDIFNGIER